MSRWADLDFEHRIVEILKDATRREHHFGRPFLTPYQIAIEFARRFPDDFRDLEQNGFPMGGEGAGVSNSLPQYIANELSTRILHGSLRENIEGGVISSRDMHELSFNFREQTVRSSLTHAGQDLTLFRLGP